MTAAGAGSVNGKTISFPLSTTGTTSITPAGPLTLALYSTTTASVTPAPVMSATPAPTASATPTPVATATPVPVVSTSSLLFDATAPSTQNFTVSETADTAPFTAAIACTASGTIVTPTTAAYVAQLAATTAASVNGSATFSVAGGNDLGTCTVTVTDAHGATANVSVAVDKSTLTISGNHRSY